MVKIQVDDFDYSEAIKKVNELLDKENISATEIVDLVIDIILN